MEQPRRGQIRKGLGAALFGGWLLAMGFLEWRRQRYAHQRARNALHPESTQELLHSLDLLRPYRDAESRALSRQLEDALKRKDPKAWQQAQQHSQ